MCDTFVALGNSTASGSVLLAKSADTEVNEAEHVVRYPRREYGEGALVRITHRTIPQARVTHETILGRSFWAWGAELGCNEHGVAVGNEAAFSNQKAETDGTCCLDLCRLPVERGETARQAVEVVGQVVEAFGQGGNCQMMGNFPFDTGLLIADRHEAYVVNCAGKHWAARKVDDVMAISNRYQITDDWDMSSLQPGNGAKPDFRATFADEKRENEAAALKRECRALELLQARKGSITVKDMADILRDLGDDPDSYNIPEDELPTRICMHAGPSELRFWHATGAMITDSSDEGVLVWMTATSATDLSIFKPLFFGAEMPDMGPPPMGIHTDGSLWWKHEHLHRRAVADYHALKADIRGDFDALETEFFAEGPSVKKADAHIKTNFVKDCWRRAEEATDRWIEKLERRNYFIADPAYRAMWDRFNREGSMPIPHHPVG
ncbi:MAG: C69 family dipeptidase [Pirellulales bacterium]